MSFASKLLATALLCAALATSSQAQARPSREKRLYEDGADDHRRRARAVSEGWLSSIVVVVDKAGNVAASLRGDGTNPRTMEFGRQGLYSYGVKHR